MKPEDAAYRVPDQRCPGLAIRVASRGGKSWDLAFRIRGAGKVRRTSLGPFPAVSLDQARARATELLRAAQIGRDLLAEEVRATAEASKRLTVDALINLYLRRRVAGKLRTAHEIELRLRRSLASVRGHIAADLRRRDVRPIFDAVADRGVEREAEKQRQCVGAMFRWALGQDIVDIDPTAGLSSYGEPGLRDRILDSGEIRTFWEWLTISKLPPDYIDAMRLQLLIGCRIGEISGVAAEEIVGGVWTLPAVRSKNGKPRATPLVGLAKDIIDLRLERTSHGPLFVTERGDPLRSNHVASILVKNRRRVPLDHFTTHDLRRTVATGLVDLGVSYETVAAVLGHEAGGADVRILTRHYVRSDLVERKRAALIAWNDRVRRIIAGNEGASNVIDMAGGRRSSGIT